jgi:hypothetical protein
MPVYNVRGPRRFPTGIVYTKEKARTEIREQIERQMVPVVEQSIGIMRAREKARAAHLPEGMVDAALANNEIEGAEKQGKTWHISPSKFDAWIKEHKP